ncbi:DinB family protein [Streptomyces armeniacus]|uniref:DinB family protein n=1 Tax=Streptomyces armeniacus TaxID=83291 RepID=A0A345XPN4_9ACTN|nr:DinB family protein [Streptomyces armeniacus]AXK33600.1 DinB family protein [Streptomyces armeniacus]
MPTLVDAENTGDERGALLAYLEAQRGGIRRALHGLTPEQAASSPSASSLSVAGLVKHVAEVEQGWLRDARGLPHAVHRDETNWSGCFELEGDETVESVLRFYAEVARETEELVRAVPSLDDTFALPEAPWNPKEPRSWRWMLLSLISEVARHAGHADIIRETLDGKTAFELVWETGAAPRPEGL